MWVPRLLAARALVTALVLVSSGGLTGQDRKDPEPKKAAKGQLPLRWSKVDLADEQKAETYKLNAEYQAKVEKLREEIRVLQAELARKRVAVRTAEHKKRLADVVTADHRHPRTRDRRGRLWSGPVTRRTWR